MRKWIKKAAYIYHILFILNGLRNCHKKILYYADFGRVKSIIGEYLGLPEGDKTGSDGARTRNLWIDSPEL